MSIRPMLRTMKSGSCFGHIVVASSKVLNDSILRRVGVKLRSPFDRA